METSQPVTTPTKTLAQAVADKSPTRIRNYQITFYKKAEDGKQDEFLGVINLDDTGTSRELTLIAKAWRQAAPKCLFADKVTVVEVRG